MKDVWKEKNKTIIGINDGTGIQCSALSTHNQYINQSKGISIK